MEPSAGGPFEGSLFLTFVGTRDSKYGGHGMCTPVGCLLRSRNLLIPASASGAACKAAQYEVHEIHRKGVLHRKGVAACEGGAGTAGERGLKV